MESCKRPCAAQPGCSIWFFAQSYVVQHTRQAACAAAQDAGACWQHPWMAAWRCWMRAAASCCRLCARTPSTACACAGCRRARASSPPGARAPWPAGHAPRVRRQVLLLLRQMFGSSKRLRSHINAGCWIPRGSAWGQACMPWSPSLLWTARYGDLWLLLQRGRRVRARRCSGRPARSPTRRRCRMWSCWRAAARRSWRCATRAACACLTLKPRPRAARST